MGSNYKINIVTLGGFCAVDRLGMQVIKIGRTCRRLFVYLLLNANLPICREQIAEVFYPEIETDKSCHSLTTSLWRLRNTVKQTPLQNYFEIISVENQIILKCETMDVWDAFRFDALVNASLLFDGGANYDSSDLMAAVDLYKGPFMWGEDDDWILFERSRLHRLYIRAQQLLMITFARQKNFEAALEKGRIILKEDPLREGTHRAMMLLYMANAQRSEAIKQFQECEKLLDIECGIEPLPETKSIIDVVKNGNRDEVIKMLGEITEFEMA